MKEREGEREREREREGEKERESRGVGILRGILSLILLCRSTQGPVLFTSAKSPARRCLSVSMTVVAPSYAFSSAEAVIAFSESIPAFLFRVARTFFLTVC